jgi:electron transfer flavoprotein beta subunit
MGNGTEDFQRDRIYRSHWRGYFSDDGISNKIIFTTKESLRVLRGKKEFQSRRTTLKIIACIKQVPDSEAKVKAEDGQVTWGDAPLVINPFDEYAVEGALQQKEALGGTVTALCIGPESAKDALKHALAMGADEAILVSDPEMTEIDTAGAARVLAAAINKIGGADMVIFGRQTLDNGAGLTPAQTARILGWPMLGLAGQIKVDGGSVTVDRVLEEGRQTVSAKMPAVLSVVQSIGEPRYPSFMGIRKASKATIPVWSLVDINTAAPAPVITRTELMNPPAQEKEVEMITGENAAEIADKLADKILAEKVL